MEDRSHGSGESGGSLFGGGSNWWDAHADVGSHRWLGGFNVKCEKKNHLPITTSRFSMHTEVGHSNEKRQEREKQRRGEGIPRKA